MKPMKFWAETDADTEKFFNYLLSIGVDDFKGCTDSIRRKYSEEGIGWYVSENGFITWTSPVANSDDYFENHQYEQFFFPIPIELPEEEETKHSHYKKDVSHLQFIDVYRVLELYNVTNPCIQHAIKKLLVAGGRGAGKDVAQDIQEAIDSLVRWQDMKKEDEK